MGATRFRVECAFLGIYKGIVVHDRAKRKTSTEGSHRKPLRVERREPLESIRPSRNGRDMLMELLDAQALSTKSMCRRGSHAGSGRGIYDMSPHRINHDAGSSDPHPILRLRHPRADGHPNLGRERWFFGRRLSLHRCSAPHAGTP